MYWISLDLQKPSLLENNPNNNWSNMKSQIKNKQKKEVEVCGITNTNIKQHY